MDTTKVKLGTCKVKYNGVDLGHTKGDVNVRYTPEYHEVTVNLYGKSVVNKVLIGEKVEADVPLCETDISLLSTISPMGVLVTDSVDGSKKMITFGSEPGKDLLSTAKELIFHPIWKPDADTSMDFVVYKGAFTSGLEMGYKVEGELVYNCKVEGLIDETKNNGSRLCCFGDKTANGDFTAPAVSSVVPANNAAAVAKDASTTIQWTMSKALDPSSVIAEHILVLDAANTPKAGSITYDPVNKKIIFSPSAPWTGTTVYTAMLTTGIKSVNGVALAAPYISKFTTAA